MSSPKHLVVGLFVLTGIALLVVMIVWFESVALFLRGGYEVSAHLDNGQGIRSGQRVYEDGIDIGEVRIMETSLPEREGVWTRMSIKQGVQIPADYRFFVQQQTVGGILLDFEAPEPLAGQPAAPRSQKPAGFLPTDGTAQIEGIVSPPSLLPKDITDKFARIADDFHAATGQLKGLQDLIADLRQLAEPRTLKEVEEGKKPPNLATALAQFQLTAKGLQDEISDPKSDFNLLLIDARKASANLSQTLGEVDKTLATVRVTAETYTKAGVSLEEASKKANEALTAFTKDAQEVSDLVKDMSSIVEGIQKGRGTLGQLATSDELHRDLVNLVENLTKMADSANRALTMWREQGLFTKEKK